MRTAIIISFLSLLLALPARTAAPMPKEGDFIARDFHFRSGEVLPGLRLHYTTLGTPRRGADGRVNNAVLMLHGTTGTGRNFLAPSFADELYGPGQPLDAARYYLILPDGIGRGGSSKPSDGMHARFPRYGYQDVVEAQHLLVTQGLGVEHLRLVLGTSMGGMQTWMWGESYPAMMDGLMPIASQPTQISGRNLLWRRIITEAIRQDPDWKGGDYQAAPTRWASAMPAFTIMADSPVRLQAQAPTRAAGNALYDQLVANAIKTIDPNDCLYWFDSSWDYDPEPGLNQIKARLLAVNFADDQINPSDLGVMKQLVARVPNGRFALVPMSGRTMGHQTLSQAGVWKSLLEQLLRPWTSGQSPQGTGWGMDGIM